jgi:hypothetical protein
MSAYAEVSGHDRTQPAPTRIKYRMDELKEKSGRKHSWLLIAGGAVLGILGTLLVTWLFKGT